MARKKKISPKELKEDKLVTGLMKAREFLQAHRNQIWNLLTGIVVLAIVVYAISSHKKRAEAESRRWLSAAIEKYAATLQYAPDSDVRTKLEEARGEFEEVRNLYATTKAAGTALLYLGHIDYRLGEYEKALECYKQFLREHPDSPFAAQAQEGVGYCLEELGRLEEALEAYKKVAEYENSYLICEVGLNVGRCLERLGRLEEAKAEYEKVIEEFPNTIQEKLARRRLNLLGEGPDEKLLEQAKQALEGATQEDTSTSSEQ